MVHNIGDRQGDEISGLFRWRRLAGLQPELEMVLITRRVYLYAHPRIMHAGRRAGRVAEVFRQDFDGLVDFFEPEMQQVNYDLAMEGSVEEFRQRCRPFLDLGSRKGHNYFLYERVESARKLWPARWGWTGGAWRTSTSRLCG